MQAMSNKSNSSENTKPINYEDGLLAAKYVADLAKDAKSKVAICGGLALHIYGFTRATKDIDLLGEKSLNIKQKRKLNFGGYAYVVKIGEKTIEVDLIIRDDEVRDLYKQALDTAVVNKEIGIRVITPEYLTILKYLAGRGKDQIDLMWLLREGGLVDRNKVNSIIKKNMGKHSYWALRDMDNLYLEADLLRARDNRDE
jgi:hypothetical protein